MHLKNETILQNGKHQQQQLFANKRTLRPYPGDYLNWLVALCSRLPSQLFFPSKRFQNG